MIDRISRAVRGHRATRATAAAVALVAVVVCAIVVARSDDGHVSARGVATPSTPASSPSRPVAPTRTPPPLSDARPPAPASAPSAGSRPVRLQIPSIKVDSSLESLDVTKAGVLQTPTRWQRAGWYADGTRPGDVGPAVIAGHVDSRSGPAVFFRLSQLHRGASVIVTRADDRRLTFVVDAEREYPKRSFPTNAVYGPTSLPVLRLITCTGDFDYDKRSYVDNLVVTSHLTNP